LVNVDHTVTTRFTVGPSPATGPPDPLNVVKADILARTKVFNITISGMSGMAVLAVVE